MKKITLLFSCIAISSHGLLFSQAPHKLSIERATVFLSGAELTSTAALTLSKGENEILFTNVAGDVNNQSIIVNATNGVVVESSTFKNDYAVTDNVSPKVKMLKDSIEMVNAQRQPVNNKIAMLTEQLAVLQSNRKISGDNTGLNVTELQKMLDLISAKMEAILNLKNRQQDVLKKIDEHIARLNSQLEAEQQIEYQPGGQLLVKFFAKEATSSNVRITYIVTGAGWTPTYDVMADDIKSPVKLFYKANIFQNSGVQWNNVRLTLSTGNPQEGMQAPVLSPWYLAFYTAPLVIPTYKLSAPITELDKEGVADTMVIEDPVVGGTWSTKSALTLSAASETSMNEHVATNNAGVNTTFDIDLPYTIPSDGQQHLVAVKKYDAPATFRYITAPKLDKDAFLQAQLTDWEDYNLLPGQTNIFYEGTYVGQGSIDPRAAKDSLDLSLGRDKKIVVTRERDKQQRSVKMIGTNVRETFAYNISVRNTRKEPITIVVQDQQPVSNDKDIVIEEKETGNSAYEETTGLMTWTLTLAPNETKKLNFGYTIKYPKGKTLDNMR